MEFYISPETRTNVENKLNKMFKHLSEKPQISFSPVEKIIKTTIIDQGCDGHSIKRCKINAIRVEISDIKTGDWTLVATVQYGEQRILMSDSRFFKNIPEKYGLDYLKCDHCGSTHTRRIESHIMYNQKTGEWMQVGSTCVNKMINDAKYINGLAIKLYDLVSLVGGCGEEDWFSGGWRPSYKYLHEGIYFEEGMEYCLSYMKKHGNVWQKSVWDYGRKIADGTNDDLIRYMKDPDSEKTIDQDLLNSVRNYYMGMERGVDDPYDGPNLTQKIIDAFNDDFITLNELYIAWFAINNYKNHISSASFKERIDNLGITKGTEYEFCGNLECFNKFETYNWRGEETFAWTAIFKDDNTGLIFTKDVSDKMTVEKYLCEDGKYRFNATVKYISYNKQQIAFGGRLRKSREK